MERGLGWLLQGSIAETVCERVVGRERGGQRDTREAVRGVLR